jgi:hypothetical protein
LNSPPPSFSFIPPPIPRIASTGLIFPLTYMCTQYCTIFNLIHIFPTSFPLPLVPTPQTGPVPPSCSPIL